MHNISAANIGAHQSECGREISCTFCIYENTTCNADGRGEYLPWPTHETTSRITVSVTYANMHGRKLVVRGSAYNEHVPIPACPGGQ